MRLFGASNEYAGSTCNFVAECFFRAGHEYVLCGCSRNGLDAECVIVCRNVLESVPMACRVYGLGGLEAHACDLVDPFWNKTPVRERRVQGDIAWAVQVVRD